MAPSFTTYWVAQAGQVRIIVERALGRGEKRSINPNARPLARRRALCDSRRGTGGAPKLAAIAEFDSVGLRYGTGAEVLRDLDFSLGTGGFYFLTGPSGAGKTSLLKLLYLAQRPTRGRIRLFGEELSEAPRDVLPAFRRRIGVVFQDFRLIRHLSAFDNVALPLRIAGRSTMEVDGPVREMLAWVGLADRASARPPTLSGGEQQRVAIARAVISQPDLLVADEPTGNVDAEMAQRLLHLFTALNRLGTTILVATHDLGLIAATPGAQMIRLEDGKIVDPTGALRNPPLRPASRA
jgi:cell division transport system ATP-binding protein